MYRAGTPGIGSWWSSDRIDCEAYCIPGETRDLHAATGTVVEADDDDMAADVMNGIDEMAADMDAIAAYYRERYPDADFVADPIEANSHVQIRDIDAEVIGAVVAA